MPATTAYHIVEEEPGSFRLELAVKGISPEEHGWKAVVDAIHREVRHALADVEEAFKASTS